MNIAEARAYKDGIDFYINSKNITVNATLDPYTDDVVITTFNYIRPVEKIRRNYLLIFAISMIFSIIFKYFENFKIEVIGIISLIWIGVFLYYLIESKNEDNFITFKYHAAEHKALNYYDKYGKSTLDYDEIMKMSSISYRCGSTTIAVVLIFCTISILGILFIPFVLFKIFWILISAFITLYLWANDKCYFLQKMVLHEPDIEQVKVACYGMWVYIGMKEKV